MSTASLTIDLDESRLPLKVLNLAWPVIGEQTSATFVGLISTIMVGRLGAAALAAVGLATQATFIPQVVFNGVAVGATAIIARRIGEGKPREASDALQQSILIAAIIGLIFAPLTWIFAEQLMVLLRAEPDVVKLGATYIRASAPGMVPCLIMFSANAARRGSGDTRSPMINMITTDISNTLLSYMLIYGFLGIPALGILGAGVAISIAWTIGCLLSLAFVIKGVGFLRYDVRRALFIDFGTIKRIMTVGFPAAIEQFQMQIAFTLFSVIISGLGTTVYAAHMVALRVENIAFMPGFALGVAATTLVGQALGAGRTDLAQRSAKIAQWYAIGLMTIVGILMGVFRTELMSVFVSDKEVIEIGTMAMIIYAFSMPFMGTSNCLAGSLRGAGDTRAVLMIMSSGIWLIRLPLAYILAYWFGFGAVGAWSAAVVDLDMRGILAWWRFTSGHWKTIRV